jgi:hypothetical protein
MTLALLYSGGDGSLRQSDTLNLGEHNRVAASFLDMLSISLPVQEPSYQQKQITFVHGRPEMQCL